MNIFYWICNICLLSTIVIISWNSLKSWEKRKKVVGEHPEIHWERKGVTLVWAYLPDLTPVPEERRKGQDEGWEIWHFGPRSEEDWKYYRYTSLAISIPAWGNQRIIWLNLAFRVETLEQRLNIEEYKPAMISYSSALGRQQRHRACSPSLTLPKLSSPTPSQYILRPHKQL